MSTRLTHILDFFQRMIGLMFMRVNSQCAHQVRPPSKWRTRIAEGAHAGLLDFSRVGRITP
jgi:hypothetical protein